MQREIETLIPSDGSDDDLPFLPGLGNITIIQPRKKTFDELFKENADLIESQERQRKDLEEIAALQTQDTLSNDEKSFPEEDELYEKNKNLREGNELDEENESDTFEEPLLRLFGELNHLQFISWDDLTLPKCEFDSSLELSELENLFISLTESELHEEIMNCEAFSPKNFKQLNPFVQYVFKTMSLHSDAAYVKACQKFIKKAGKLHHIQNLSISYADIFVVLFNYGVDVRKDIFNMLPGSKEIRKCAIRKEIPRNWMHNVKAVLSSIADLMKCCKMEEDDLFNVFVYLLWMSMDDFLNINTALQLCTEIIVKKFSEENWPDWRLKITEFVLSINAQMSNQWNLMLRMIKCIDSETARGVELRNYLSYVALRKLTAETSDSNVISKYFIPKFSGKLFSAKNLQPILESICDMEKNMQLTAIKFLDLFTMSLNLSSKEEHDKLLVLIKRCENSISRHATIQQSQLCLLHSRISTLTPCESMDQMFDGVEEQQEVSDDEDYDDSEMGGDASQSSSNEQSLNEEFRAVVASNASNDRSLKKNATLRSNMFDDVEKQLEMSDDNVSMDDDASQSPLNEESLSEEQSAGFASYGSDVRSTKQNAPLQSNMFDDVEKQLEMSDENASMHEDISQSLLGDQLTSEGLKAGFANYASNDWTQKQNSTLQSYVKGAVLSPDISSKDEWEASSEILRPNTESDRETEFSLERLRPTAESDNKTESNSERVNHLSDEEIEINSAKYNYFTPSKSSLIDHHYARKKSSSEKFSKNLNACFDKFAQRNNQCEDKQLITNQSEGENILETAPIIQGETLNKTSATCPSRNLHKTFEKCAPESFSDNLSDVSIKNKGSVTDSLNDERSNIYSKLSTKIQSEGVVPAEHQKKFQIYQNSSAEQTSTVHLAPKVSEVDSNVIKQIGKNSAEECSHINASSSANNFRAPDCEKSSDAYSQACSITNPDNLTVANESEEMRSSLILDSKNFTSAKSIAHVNVSHSLSTEVSSQLQMKIQKDSSQSETMQNIISSQILNSCSVSETSMNNRNVISNIECCDEVETSELIRPNKDDNTEAAFINSEIEKKIFEFQNNFSLNETLQTLDSPLSLISNLVSGYSVINEPFPGVNFPGVFVLPPFTKDSSKSSNNDANIVPKILNVEKDKNAVSVQPKDVTDAFVPVSTPIDISLHPSTLNESNSTKTVASELYSELTIPVVEKTDEFIKESSDDLKITKKSTSSATLMPEKDLDTLYCDMMVSNANLLDTSVNATKKSKEDPNPLDTLMKSKEDGHFIPRSVHIKTAKTMHPSDLNVRQGSDNVLTSNSQNLVQNSSFKNIEICNSSEQKSAMHTELVISSTQIIESKKSLSDKAKIDMFKNESENVETGSGTSFKPNIVHLRSVENIQGSEIGKTNNSDSEKQKTFCMPSLNNNTDKNRKLLSNNGIKPTNDSVTGFNFNHDEPYVEHQNIATRNLPNAASPKRKQTDSIFKLTFKRPRITNKQPWIVNFPALLPPATSLSRDKDAVSYPIDPFANKPSSIYYTQICNSQLTNEIPGIMESSEIVTDHPSSTEPIGNKNNSEILNIKDLSSENVRDSDSSSSNDSDSSSSSGSDSSSSSKTTSSSKTSCSIKTCNSDSKSQSNSLNINKSSNLHKKNDSQAAQPAVVDDVESITSDSEDEIQVIEEVSRNKTNAQNKSNNSLPSHTMDKREKYNMFKNTNQTPNQNSVKVPSKPNQSNLVKYFHMDRNKPVSLFKFGEDILADKLVKSESAKTKKTGNNQQREQKNSASGFSSAKKTRLTQTSLSSVPISLTKASSSRNQAPDILCLDISDTECSIIEPNDGPDIIDLD